MPGDVLGHYRLKEEIGAGGMGVVYQAWDTRLERDVAIKVLNPHRLTDDSARRRFRREALILSRLNHPNIETVFDFHDHDGLDYLVLEYVAGTSLSTRLETGPLPEHEVVTIGLQLAKGLAAAHAKHILHRDLKPGNLRLTPDNTLKILDFGLAQLFYQEGVSVMDTVTVQSPLAGTPPYLSPEQVEGREPDVRSDIYSAGVVLYELSTGSRPFGYHGPKLLEAIARDKPPQPRSSNKNISRSFEAVILKCLNKDPKLRYQSANELLADLEELARVSGPHRPVGIYVRHLRINRKLVLGVVALLILLAIAVGNREQIQDWLHIRFGTVSLAVLPLENRTGDAKLDYLSTGVSESLTNDLARVPDMQVTAEEVARRYAGDKTDPLAVGRSLKVDSIVYGSLNVDNGKVRIPVELISTKTGRQIWGQVYEGDLSQLPSLQRQISTDVAYRLKYKADANMDARLRRQYATNTATYDFYLKGRFHLAQRRPDILQQAISDFQRALDHDPQFAPAYAGLADCYSLLAYYGVDKPLPLFTKAMTYAQQALELDSTLGEAYTSRAAASVFISFDWKGAESDYKRAIELNPKYVTAHNWYAMSLLAPLGRRTEAATQLSYSLDADPGSMVTNVLLATFEYMSGNPDKSMEVLKAHVPPTFEPGLQVLALDYLAKGMPEKAVSVLETAQALDPSIRASRATPLGIAYAKTRDRAKALEQLNLLTAAIEHGDFLSYQAAALYTVLDNREKALDMLELAFSRRESNVIFLNVDPLLIPLHSEPRFQKLLQQMNML